MWGRSDSEAIVPFYNLTLKTDKPTENEENVSESKDCTSLIQTKTLWKQMSQN